LCLREQMRNLLLHDERHLNSIQNKTLFKAPGRRRTESITR
jgi:hypothetical protein